MSDTFWEQFALADPLWAILSDPSKKGRRWELGPFLETGRREVSLLLYQLKQLGQVPASRVALDFGCGVGRLTQALAEHFRTVIAVDVSATMVRLARQLNRHADRVRYIENHAPDLSIFDSESFDFIYSDIVLQHIEPEKSLNYVREFLRVVRPGGVVVFQLASHLRPEAPNTSPVSMPDEAYRVRLEVTALTSLPAPGARATVPVHATNTSPIIWPRTAGEVRIGNHWLDATTGAMLVQDDGRVALHDDVAPGQRQLILLPIQAPAEPGEYVCEIDAVHEGISWFADRGGSSVKFPVTIRSDAGTRTTAEALDSTTTMQAPSEPYPDIYATLPPCVAEPGDFPMFGVPHDVVRRVIEENGGRVFHLEPDERCGKEWVGFRFFVSKANKG